MKNLKTVVKKMSPVIATCLTFILTLHANSSGCFIVYQPKVPKSLDNFKKVK